MEYTQKWTHENMSMYLTQYIHLNSNLMNNVIL